ncbi:MAG: hypothetical protein COA32_08660 [Fluviicola sp.]|nr:MAG: hypothetical protein COA32_08660 [Fluviicola sp.]
MKAINNIRLNRVKSLMLASVFMISFSYGQETEKKKAEHGIGFQIGGTTGHGLTYRYYGNKIGVQVSALPIFMQNDEFLMSAGLTGMYKIAESKRIDLVAYLGNHFVTRDPEVIINESDNQTIQPNQPVSNSLLDQHILAKLLTGGSEAYQRLSYNMSIGLGGVLHSKNRFINFNFFTGYGIYSLNREPLSALSLTVGITFKLN